MTVTVHLLECGSTDLDKRMCGARTTKQGLGAERSFRGDRIFWFANEIAARVAKKHPDVVAYLRNRMDAHIAEREKATGIQNPMVTQGAWHGSMTKDRMESSQEAYDTLRIGDAATAKKLQEESRK